SRDALAATELQLLQATDGAKPEEITELADQLFAVAGLLTRESGLRRALADISAEPQAREELARNLLADRLGPRALPVVVEAVRARWSGPQDLVAGLERMARVALLVQAERAGRLDAVEDELFRLGRIIGGQVDLDRLLSDPTGNAAGKLAVIDQLVSGKVEPITASLVRQLVSQPHGRRVSEGLERRAALPPKRRDRRLAPAAPASPATRDESQRVGAACNRFNCRPSPC